MSNKRPRLETPHLISDILTLLCEYLEAMDLLSFQLVNKEWNFSYHRTRVSIPTKVSALCQQLVKDPLDNTNSYVLNHVKNILDVYHKQDMGFRMTNRLRNEWLTFVKSLRPRQGI